MAKPKAKRAAKPGPKSSSKPKPRAMQLEVESGRIVRNVAATDLRSAIEGEKFAILGGGPRSGTYIQCAEQDEAPFLYILEYQDGSTAKHFTASPAGIPFDTIVATFEKYLNHDPSWRTDFTWKRMKL